MCETCKHILFHVAAELSLVFCDSKKLRSIVDSAEGTSFLKTVIIFDDMLDSALIEKCDAVGIKLLTMSELLVSIFTIYTLLPFTVNAHQSSVS